MAKKVGLSRAIKLSWLNYTVDLKKQGLSDKEIRRLLDEYLSFEIRDKTNLNKARNILMNLWVSSDEEAKLIQMKALELAEKYPEYIVSLHWAMFMYSYPVFRDICKLIGKMFEYQDEITLSNIKQKLYDEWGERTTLMYAVEKLTSTFRYLGVLENVKPGRYILKKIHLKNEEIISFLIYVVMKIDEGGYYSFQDVNGSTYLFPFEYWVTKEMLLQDEHFVMNNFGGELSIALKDVIID